MIWVGTCRWDLKSRPIFIPNFTKKWDPFLYQSHKFKQNLPKFHIIFQNHKAFKQILEILVSDWWNWAYFRDNFRQFWKYDPCLYQFLHWMSSGVIVIPGCWFWDQFQRHVPGQTFVLRSPPGVIQLGICGNHAQQSTHLGAGSEFEKRCLNQSRFLQQNLHESLDSI